MKHRQSKSLSFSEINEMAARILEIANPLTEGAVSHLGSAAPAMLDPRELQVEDTNGVLRDIMKSSLTEQWWGYPSSQKTVTENDDGISVQDQNGAAVFSHEGDAFLKIGGVSSDQLSSSDWAEIKAFLALYYSDGADLESGLMSFPSLQAFHSRSDHQHESKSGSKKKALTEAKSILKEDHGDVEFFFNVDAFFKDIPTDADGHTDETALESMQAEISAAFYAVVHPDASKKMADYLKTKSKFQQHLKNHVSESRSGSKKKS